MNMDSFHKAPCFIYNPNPNSNPESEDVFSGILEIHLHHARNIHNICIYEKQDVYAKFSLTYNPDETFSTRIIKGGGKNPNFNQDLIVKINQPDAVLKCEIWMLSRAKNYMDDQLLGFALVPISSVSCKGKVTQDFDLSSTDLFHSPAGTIKLSISLTSNTPLKTPCVLFTNSSTSQLLLDKKITEDYSRIQFPDISVVKENQQMASEYFAQNGTPFMPWLEKPDGSFLHLGAAPHVEDYEMAGNSSDENPTDSVSPDGSSAQNSGFLSSTMTSLSDDRNSGDSMDKKSHVFTDFSTDNASVVAETPTSQKKSESQEEREINFLQNEEESNNKKVRNIINIEDEESAMQKHIVDMYMRSMQQFTDSLAKMKLPMDMSKAQVDDIDEGQNSDKKIEIENKNKDNTRVFYGSRAFF